MATRSGPRVYRKQGLKRAAPAPTTMAKPTEVVQKQTETPTEFYERLFKTYRLYINRFRGSLVSNCDKHRLCISSLPSYQAQAPKVRWRVLAMTSSQIEIANKVFRKRDVEAKKKAEKKRREGNKRADQRIELLAALGRPFPGPSPKPPPPLNQRWSPGKPPTRKPRTTLQPNQCA